MNPLIFLKTRRGGESIGVNCDEMINLWEQTGNIYYKSTNMNTISKAEEKNNRLLNWFMGYEYDTRGYAFSSTEKKNDYHTNWQSLMLVAKKFDKLALSNKEYEALCDEIDEAVTKYEIKDVYPLLVKAVRWCKKQLVEPSAFEGIISIVNRHAGQTAKAEDLRKLKEALPAYACEAKKSDPFPTGSFISPLPLFESVFRIPEYYKTLIDKYSDKPKREWSILHQEKDGLRILSSHHTEEGAVIKSVVRESDGVVFKIGDRCIYGKTLEFTITGFSLSRNKNDMCVHNGPCMIFGLNYITAYRPRLFTTKDCKPVYSGDDVWQVHSDYTISMLYRWSENWKTQIDLKYFSTREAAYQYVLRNKPCLSYNDVIENHLYRGEDTREVQDRLMGIVKEKINGK